MAVKKKTAAVKKPKPQVVMYSADAYGDPMMFDADDTKRIEEEAREWALNDGSRIMLGKVTPIGEWKTSFSPIK
jgi:hypothetical protein